MNEKDSRTDYIDPLTIGWEQWEVDEYNRKEEWEKYGFDTKEEWEKAERKRKARTKDRYIPMLTMSEFRNLYGRITYKELKKRNSECQIE